jgi:hypothetical protein
VCRYKHLPYQGEFPMSTLKNLSLNLEVGQTILVGHNDTRAQITKIEFHEKLTTIHTQTLQTNIVNT